MPRHEPARSQTAGEPPPLKLKVQLDPQGRWQAVSRRERPRDDRGRRAPARRTTRGPPRSSRALARLALQPHETVGDIVDLVAQPPLHVPAARSPPRR